jgi:hypothetical protein
MSFQLDDSMPYLQQNPLIYFPGIPLTFARSGTDKNSKNIDTLIKYLIPYQLIEFY